jgi:hypothetical protein
MIGYLEIGLRIGEKIVEIYEAWYILIYCLNYTLFFKNIFHIFYN